MQNPIEIVVTNGDLTETTQSEIHDKVESFRQEHRRLKAFRVRLDLQDSTTAVAEIRVWTSFDPAVSVESFKPDFATSQSGETVLKAVDTAIESIDGQLLEGKEIPVAARSSWVKSPFVWIGLFGLLLAVLIMAMLKTDGPGTVPVDGVVIYKDEPLANAKIVFYPEDNTRPAVAVTNEEGKFSLSSFKNDGAFPGNYTVTVVVAPIVKTPSTSIEEDFDKSIEEGLAKVAEEERTGREEVVEYPIPTFYMYASQSPLKVTIPHEGPVDLILTEDGTQQTAPN